MLSNLAWAVSTDTYPSLVHWKFKIAISYDFQHKLPLTDIEVQSCPGTLLQRELWSGCRKDICMRAGTVFPPCLFKFKCISKLISWICRHTCVYLFDGCWCLPWGLHIYTHATHTCAMLPMYTHMQHIPVLCIHTCNTYLCYVYTHAIHTCTMHTYIYTHKRMYIYTSIEIFVI
jgi:hypothetical protein